jgi:hypothetical protein
MADLVVSTPRKDNGRRGDGCAFWESSPATSVECRQMSTTLLCERLQHRRGFSPQKETGNSASLEMAASIESVGSNDATPPKENATVEGSPGALFLTAVDGVEERDSTVRTPVRNENERLTQSTITPIPEEPESYYESDNSEASSFFDEDDVAQAPSPEGGSGEYFVGIKAKEGFFHALSATSSLRKKNSMFKYQISEQVPDRIQACTGIKKLKPLSPRSKVLTLFENEMLVPEPLLVRANDEETLLGLQNLSLGNKKLSLLSTALPSLPHIKELNLANNNLSRQSLDELFRAMKPMQTITSLNLNRNKVSRSCLSSLAHLLLSKGNQIESVFLKGCGIGNRGIKSFSTTLLDNSPSGKMRHLLELDLQKNNIVSCSYLVDLLPHLKCLGTLNLAWNPIKGKEASKIASVCHSSTDIKRLSFAWCPLFPCESPEVYAEFGRLIECSRTLAWLDLSCTGFSKVSCLAEGIASNRTLKHLSLSNNRIPPEEAAVFAEALKSNHTLLGLHMLIGNAAHVDHFGFCIPIKDGRMRNLSRLIYEGIEEQANGMPSENCWVCEGWQEIRFSWTPGVSGGGGQKVSLCLSIERWVPQEMTYNTELEAYELYRVVPPGKIKYMFQIDEGYEFDSRYETTSLKLWPLGPRLAVNVLHVPPRNIQEPVSFKYTKPRPLKKGETGLAKGKSFSLIQSVFAKRFKTNRHFDHVAQAGAWENDVARFCSCEGPSKIIKDEVDVLKMNLVTEQHYVHLTAIFNYYCKNVTGEEDILHSTEFQNMLTDSGLAENASNKSGDSLLNHIVSSTDASIIYTAANFVTKEGLEKLKGQHMTTHGFCRFQFFESLYRLAVAIHKTLQKGGANDSLLVGNVYEQMVKNHLTKFCTHNYSDDFRKGKVYVWETEALLRKNSLELKTLYKKLTGLEMGSKGIKLDSFLQFCTVCFQDGNQEFYRGMTIPFLKDMFSLSKIIREDELNQTNSLQYTDFLEALCRIAAALTEQGVADISEKFRSVMRKEIAESTTGGRKGSWALVKNFIKNHNAIIKQEGVFVKQSSLKIIKSNLDGKELLDEAISRPSTTVTPAEESPGGLSNDGTSPAPEPSLSDPEGRQETGEEAVVAEEAEKEVDTPSPLKKTFAENLQFALSRTINYSQLKKARASHSPVPSSNDKKSVKGKH